MHIFKPSLKPNVPTQWKSHYFLLESLCKNNNYATLRIVFAENAEHDLGEFDIFCYSMSELKKLRDFYKEILDIHKTFQYENKQTTQLVVPICHEIMSNVVKYDQEELRAVKQLKKATSHHMRFKVLSKLQGLMYLKIIVFRCF